ncbi:hypothetical protein NDU88_013023 [Pleurodeles waltl]|uniref:Uncharacterized protein n=1 Tax=Pleurodeles waltl TaxID=8319 RepID=A0AAV7R7N7_PLEWA|nr:hypothetical protein NDU88_013023 [Pleurodeles waltl]
MPAGSSRSTVPGRRRARLGARDAFRQLQEHSAWTEKGPARSTGCLQAALGAQCLDGEGPGSEHGMPAGSSRSTVPGRRRARFGAREAFRQL